MWIVGFEFSLLGGVITPAFSYIVHTDFEFIHSSCLDALPCPVFLRAILPSQLNCPGNSQLPCKQRSWVHILPRAVNFSLKSFLALSIKSLYDLLYILSG